MSMNQFSTDLSQPVWWVQQQQSFMEPNQNANSSLPLHLYHRHDHYHNHRRHQQQHILFSAQNPSVSFNLNHEDVELDEQDPIGEEYDENKNCYYNDQEKEAMFEKPLTPSDVGKLNRLVIPKQHAEKYFPLSSDSVDKGLLLSFEDELGKSWRFRYSYWNSSQSYVLTKGWSRYVKEKRLDAGDVVLFERHRLDGERLFIRWRRRGEGGGVHGNNGGEWSRELCSQQQHQIYERGHVTTGVPYQPNCLHAGGQNQTTGVGNSKRFRLFGVNLELKCHPDDESSEPSTPDGSSLSSHHHQLLYTSHSP